MVTSKSFQLPAYRRIFREEGWQISLQFFAAIAYRRGMIKSLKAVSGIIAGALAIALTLYASYQAHNDSQSTFWTTMLVCFTGIAVGWLLGFAASPQNSKEEKQFTTYGKLVAGVISGYLLGRFEPSLDAIFKDGKLLTDQLYSVRLMVFVISTIVSAITMFVYRSYLYTETLARKQNG